MKVLFFALEADGPNKAGHYVFANLRAPLVKAGHEIIDFDFSEEERKYGKEKMNERLKKLILQEKPHLFFHVICGEELEKSLALYIRDQTTTTSLVFFSDDDWRLAHSLQWVEYYNVALTTSCTAHQQYQQMGYEHVLLTQYACNPDWYYPLVLPKIFDVTFVGQAYKGRPEILQFLKGNGINLRVWGTGWEQYPRLRDIAGGFLPHEKMLEIFAQSKIVLGLSWCSIDGVTPQIKGRTFEYPACKAFQLANFNQHLQTFYQEGKEIEFFKDRQELLTKIQYFLHRETLRNSIVEEAYRRTLAEHTWEQRYTEIFEKVENISPQVKQNIQVSVPSDLVSKQNDAGGAKPQSVNIVLCLEWREIYRGISRLRS